MTFFSLLLGATLILLGVGPHLLRSGSRAALFVVPTLYAVLACAVIAANAYRDVQTAKARGDFMQHCLDSHDELACKAFWGCHDLLGDPGGSS
jgi:hypothetical protein